MDIISHTERYNLLTDVEQADEQFSGLNKVLILSALCSVIRNHHLEQSVGIRLLHRHNHLDTGEVMLESAESLPSNDHILTTMALKKANIHKKFAPNTWQAEGGKFFALEYSDDPAIAGGRDFVKAYPGFFKDFEGALAQLEVSEILGPCIVHRNFFEIHRPETSAVLVETTDDKRRANMVMFVTEGHYSWNNMIQTTWMATTEPKASLGCIPVNGCIRVGGGAHTPINGHNNTGI